MGILASLCQIQLTPNNHKSLRANYLTLLREGFEPSRPCEHHDLNVACLPFHHLSEKSKLGENAWLARLSTIRLIKKSL